MYQVSYQEYLKGAHWKRQRRRSLRYHNYACQSCGRYFGKSNSWMLDIHHTPEAYGLLGREPLHLIPPLCSGRGNSTKCHPRGRYTKDAMKIDRGAWTWIRLLESVFSLRTIRIVWRVVWWLVKTTWAVLWWSWMLFLTFVGIVRGFCGSRTFFSD